MGRILDSSPGRQALLESDGEDHRCSLEVHRNLGHGSLENVYAKALFQELNTEGITVQAEHPIPVTYKGVEIGISYADLIVEHKVICEVKAVRSLLPEHQAQL